MIKDVSIEITQRCVNHCIHCSSCSSEDCTMMLQQDTLHRVIQGLHRLKVERVCLSGGEPFLHPNMNKKTVCYRDDGTVVLDFEN